MTNSAFDPKRFWRAATTNKRFWMPVSICAFALVSASMVVMPKKYQSSAQVLINKPKLETVMGGQVGDSVLDLKDHLATIREQIISYSFLDQVARKLNLGKGLNPETTAYQNMIGKMQDSIDLRVKNQDLFTIAYIADTPETARDVTAEIVNQYIIQSGQRFENKARETREFIQKELELAERELQLSQDAITKYKQQFPNEIPEAQTDNMQRLNQLRNDLQTGESALQGLQVSLMMQKKRLKDTPAEIVAQRTFQDNQNSSNLKRTKESLEAQLSMMLKDYTESHWKVKELRAQIAQTEQQIKSQSQDTTGTETMAPNPMAQTITDQIMQTEAQINQAQANISAMKSQIAQLEKWQEKVPAHQLELSRLNMAVNADSDRVIMLRKRLTDAETTANVEQRGQGPSFELSDPPRLERDPVSPNPKKFFALAFALACACGGGVIYIFMLLDNAVRSVDEARGLLQMPVLGVVQRVVTAAEQLRQKRARHMRAWGLGLGALAIICLAALSLTLLREPLSQQIDNIRSMLSQR